jgi:hypothetical protein
MKTLKVMLFMVVFCIGSNVQAAGIVVEDFNVNRFTDLGAGRVRWEQGTLYVKQGFIPITSSDFPFSTFDLTQDVVNAINGKTVATLALWTGLTNINGADYSKFTRSVETYSIDSVPNVIVSLSGAGGGSGIPTVKKPKISISAVDPQATETTGDSAQFLVALNAPTTKNIRIKLAISGKATNGKDYQRIARALLIPAGNVSGIIEIEPIDDINREGSEKVTIKLAGGGKAYTLKRAAASVTIIDND